LTPVAARIYFTTSFDYKSSLSPSGLTKGPPLPLFQNGSERSQSSVIKQVGNQIMISLSNEGVPSVPATLAEDGAEAIPVPQLHQVQAPGWPRRQRHAL
jgi:hypothetical protein